MKKTTDQSGRCERRILVVNDDGVYSKGLHALASAMRAFGEVWVVAPEKTQNAVGRAITLHKPLRMVEVRRRMFAVNGTPADCVILGIHQLLKDHKPALVVSGINKGLNLGDDVSNSGTVSAAFEGTAKGIPSIAFSLDGGHHFLFDVAASVAKIIAADVLKRGLPRETLLNVNIPNCPAASLQGVQVTSLCRRSYHDPVVEKIDPRGGKYYWIAGQQVSYRRKKESDLEAIQQHMVSITPLRLDLTQYHALPRLREMQRSVTTLLRGGHRGSVT